MRKYGNKKSGSSGYSSKDLNSSNNSNNRGVDISSRVNTSTNNKKVNGPINSSDFQCGVKRKVNIGLRLSSIVNSNLKINTDNNTTTSKVTSKLQYLRDMVSSKLRPCVKKRKSVDNNKAGSTYSLHSLHGMSSSPKQPKQHQQRTTMSANNKLLGYSSSLRSSKYCKTPVKLQSKHKTLQTLSQSFGLGQHGRLLLGAISTNNDDYITPISSSHLTTPHLESNEQLLHPNKHFISGGDDDNDLITQDIIRAVQSNYNLSKDFVLTSEGLKKIVFPTCSISSIVQNNNNNHYNDNDISSRPSSSQSLSNPYHTRQYSDSYGSYNYGQQQITLTSEDEATAAGGSGSFYGSNKKISNHHYNNSDQRCGNALVTDENDDMSYNSESRMHSTFNHHQNNHSDDTLNDIIIRNQIKASLEPTTTTDGGGGGGHIINTFNSNGLLVSNYPDPFQLNSKCCYSAETWDSMINSENQHTPRYYYLKKQKYVSTKTRAILLGWLAEVCDAFKMHRDTYYLAINFVDRYLSATSDVRCNQLQLLGISALYVAAKLEEIYPPNLQRFVNVTDGATTLEQVLVQELALVKTLKWQLNEMTAYSWLALFVLTFENYQLLQPLNFNRNNCRTHPKTRGHEKRLSRRGQWKMRCLEFPTTAFKEIVHITKLLEVVMIDAESLKYSGIVLAASVFFICRNYDQSILDFTGISFHQIENCVTWMNMYSGVVRGRRTSLSIINTSQLSANSHSSKSSTNSNSFNNIYSSNDENYTIQRHRDALKYFESYQQKAKNEQSINVPNGIIVDKCYR